jgi:hypothetical protein
MVVAAALPGCAASSAQPETPADQEPGRPTAAIAKGGRVALSSFALAGRVSWQSLRTVGGAAAGFVSDGKEGAKRGWRTGVGETRATARAEADTVKSAARSP